MSNKANNKRIAKNTLLLYFRMMLTMLVSLYTVRVVFSTLGLVDYGLYNVVGGIVVMFSFLSNTMAAASQRFFAFDLGRNDLLQLKNTFSLTSSIYFIISIIVFLLAETVGLWFLNTQMIIPLERMDAANWIYQFSILSFIVTIMVIPYNAIIIARENMAVYAYVSIIEVILKLVIVYMLLLISFEKLKLYAILMFATTCFVSLIYLVICKRKYAECRYQFHWDKNLFITLISYSGWNLFGAVATVMNNQGINILLNLFFGPAVNAAIGIAYQVNSNVNQFVMNFHLAVKPQITKYYAAEEKDKMMSLVFNSSKYSYYILFILSMPILLEANYIFIFWLKSVSAYMVLFTRLIIIIALIDSLTYSLQTVAQATGKIKLYQVVVGGMLLLNLPSSYILLKSGFPPQATMYVAIVISAICLLLRLLMLRRLVKLPVRRYIRQVLMRIFFVSIMAPIIPLFIIYRLDESFTRLIIIGLSGLISSISAIYIIGLSRNERMFLIQAIQRKFANK